MPKMQQNSKSFLLPSTGLRVCRWIESFLVHSEGSYYGRPFRLTDDQKRFLNRAYAIKADGTRQYRRVVRGRSKGHGKSELAAAVACYELGGGVHESPVIPVAAASFEQADLVFGAAKTMISEGPLAPYFEVYDTEILIKGKPGRMFRVAAAAGTNDGLKPTFMVADEVHEWLPGQKERVHLVLSNGLAKRAESWELNISTAGVDPGIETGEPETLLGRMYLYGKKVESGEIQDDGFLFDWLEATDDFDLSKREGWEAAVRSLDPPHFVNVDAVVERCLQIPEFEARRYFLNQWSYVSESWLPPNAWKNLATTFEFDDSPVWIGVDASTKHDSTGVVMVQWQDDLLYAKAQIWERPVGRDGKPIEGWKLPINEVENHLRDLHRRYDVKEICYDPALFERSAQQLEAEKLPMIETPQSDMRMTVACQTTYQLILEERLRHDGDKVFARHLASAAAKEARTGGHRLVKVKAKAKMDAAVALVMAVDAAVRKPAESVWMVTA